MRGDEASGVAAGRGAEAVSATGVMKFTDQGEGRAPSLCAGYRACRGQ